MIEEDDLLVAPKNSNILIHLMIDKSIEYL